MIVLLISFSIVALAEGVNFIKSYSEKLERIAQLEIVIKQLCNDRPIACITITEKSDNNIKATVQYLNPNLEKSDETRFIKEVSVDLKGNMLYLGFETINFEYSEIESGNNRNITIPTSIYTDLIPPEQALKVNFKNEFGIFYSFVKNDDNIYGITPEDFKKRTMEISNYFSNEQYARSNGVRSINGQAVASMLEKDDVYYVFTKQTGGLVIKKQYDKLR